MAGRPPKKIVEEFVADTFRLYTHQLAAKYNRAESTIKDWRLWCKRHGHDVGYGELPETDVRVYDDYPVLEGDFMVVGDLEVPYHDAENLRLMLAIAEKFGVRQLVINGDFLSADWLSSWPVDTGQTVPSGNEELASARKVARALESQFDLIVWTKGNHEQRATRNGVSMDTLYHALRMDERKVRISHYKFAEANTPLGDSVLISHPEHYSRIRGRVASDLADRHGMHVITNHTHLGGMTFCMRGEHVAVDIGHSTREKTRHYKMQNRTKSPGWITGFGMVRRGYIYPFYKDFTDWGLWLDEMRLTA